MGSNLLAGLKELKCMNYPEKCKKLHAGGTADKTGKFLLKKGEVVLNKVQQAKLKAAKTSAAAKKVVNTVAKKKPHSISYADLKRYGVDGRPPPKEPRRKRKEPMRMPDRGRKHTEKLMREMEEELKKYNKFNKWKLLKR